MKTINSTKEAVTLEAFESVNEFMKAIREREENEAFKSCYYFSSKAEGRKAKRFSGTENFDEAEALLKSGYKKGLKDLLTAKSPISVKAKTEAPKRSPYFYGSSLCLSNFLTGMPKTMYRRQTIEQKKRVITLNYDTAVSCDFSKEDLFTAGKNIMSLITYFENKGIKVALNVSMFINNSYTKTENIKAVSIKVKDYKQALNPLLISYPVTHPSFFRRHIFRWVETSPLTNESFFTSGYGVPSNVLYNYDIEDLQKRLKASNVLGKEGYYINAYQASKAGSIEDLLKALGVE